MTAQSAPRPVVRDVLDNGLRLITETMPHVRSVTIGVWLTRGSRHEADAQRRHRPLRRAHALQGHRHPDRRGHRPGDRLDWRPARRLHREGIRQLLHQGARRAPAAGGRAALRHRPPAGLRRRRSRAREEGDPRRDQDGRGHARRPGPRALHPALLGGASARPADSRLEGDASSRSPADSLREYFRGAYVAPQHDHLGRRQPRARGGPRARRRRRSATSRPTASRSAAARRASCRR